MNVNELKELVCKVIDDNFDKLFNLAGDIENNPELGFKEIKTAEKVCKLFDELNISYKDKLALTGVKGKLKEKSEGPNVAILGELDGVICFDSANANKETGASHTCGHNLQITAMAAAALGLKLSNIEDKLHGNVSFMAVPAEEFIEIEYRQKLKEEGKIHFLAGKQELIYRGAFDDVDMAMMIHSLKDAPKPTVALGSSSNGFIGKTIQYIGKTAHAAEAPHTGVNALNAAMLGLMGVNALRETFRDEDSIRVHPIITKGGDTVNSVPADVRMETYVRANNVDAMKITNKKVDKALIAGGYAIGAETIINTIPGHLPLKSSLPLNEIFKENSLSLLPEDSVIDAGHFAASTDMGDVSNLIPAIHPFIGGVSGALHTKDFKVEDFYSACILPGKIMAMSVIDLLFNNAEKAEEIINSYTPTFESKEKYIEFLEECFERKVEK
ncbi:amidohydrolase [Clostridium tetani]|uniref:Peptidase M20 domain-containing protein 2 n=1 Tax=Clostridium tetani (strain Massachusetts / E88) TaxID=212717 RepID=Q897R1_CLOTE|nr:amidohydrolase [Clostridium tetani]AAO35275.1 putative amidohydrolase [Clostridium tetani E88]KGI40979.1 amidohydrolase [Clostridium tetani]KGI46031.1 amidohydrolase [Clostridium tetani]KHO36905.1 amidohydrolase [Clostridium tetani]KIG20375.1 amidohydrolase [Clostridium tetani]